MNDVYKSLAYIIFSYQLDAVVVHIAAKVALTKCFMDQCSIHKMVPPSPTCIFLMVIPAYITGRRQRCGRVADL